MNDTRFGRGKLGNPCAHHFALTLALGRRQYARKFSRIEISSKPDVARKILRHGWRVLKAHGQRATSLYTQ